MGVNLKGRSFLTLKDFKPDEIRYLLDVAHEVKEKRKRHRVGDSLAGKHLVLLFEKASTRTRCSFEVAMKDEGGHVTFLDKESSQFSKKESIEDSAKVLGRYYDGIEYRGFDQCIVEQLAKYSGVPVYNGLTDIDHPTQILADIMTIEEHVKKPLKDVKVVFVGDTRNNMCHAWMYGCAKMGMKFVAYGPQSLKPDNKVINDSREICNETGGSILVSDEPSCLIGADVIYTDVWVSMGEESKMEDRVKQLSNYRVTMDMIKSTLNPNVKFMHCLPAFHDFETAVAKQAKEKGVDIREVTDEVFRSEFSVVFDEAENRMHTIKAIMMCTM